MDRPFLKILSCIYCTQVSCGRVVHDLGDCCLFDKGEMCGTYDGTECSCYQNGEDITMGSSNCIQGVW